MKRNFFAILLLAPSLAMAASPSPADYTITVHVQSSRILNLYEVSVHGHGLCSSFRRLNAVVDGKKYELEGGDCHMGVLEPGDYKARIRKEEKATAYEYQRTYEFLFPDGKTEEYVVTGQSE